MARGMHSISKSHHTLKLHQTMSRQNLDRIEGDKRREESAKKKSPTSICVGCGEQWHCERNTNCREFCEKLKEEKENDRRENGNGQ